MKISPRLATLTALGFAPCFFVPLGASTTANATGFTDLGYDIVRRDSTAVVLDGSFRLRTALLHNLDLDRGTTPSGEVLFPIPLSNPAGQTLTHADMRLRTDLTLYAPFGGVAVKVRVDTLDNLALGSLPEGNPAGSTSQRSPEVPIRIKRAYGEALTPFGLLTAGRTGSQWGLGMLTNGGDCPDCDSGDAADRIAFVTPVLQHVWALAYDFSATGPLIQRRDTRRTLDLDPADDVRSFTAAVMRFDTDLSRQRRRKANRWTFNYGSYFSVRWQDRDVPATYVPNNDPEPLGPNQVIARNYTAMAGDIWLRLDGPWMRAEVEFAVLAADVGQSSLVPGVLVNRPVKSRQFGLAFESSFGRPEGLWQAGLDFGIASGDPTPGFGALEDVNAPAALPGDLEGPQAVPPFDNNADNFRFHPDYRVDRILFRELIGTVTDALYLRPHGRIRLREFGPGVLSLQLAMIVSSALEATSTPGGKTLLGLELDPTLVYESRDGFSMALEYAALFPFEGLDNPSQNLQAQPAQLMRLRLGYLF